MEDVAALEADAELVAGDVEVVVGVVAEVRAEVELQILLHFKKGSKELKERKLPNIEGAVLVHFTEFFGKNIHFDFL